MATPHHGTPTHLQRDDREAADPTLMPMPADIPLGARVPVPRPAVLPKRKLNGSFSSSQFM